MRQNYVRLIGCWGLVVLHFLVLSGQQYLSTPVSSADKKYYEGRIDDLNKVQVTLVCVTGNCTGDLVYVKSGDRFSLKGTQKDNQLTLEEYDQFNQLSGLLKGRFVGKTIEAMWENAAQTVGSEFFLKEIVSATKGSSDCGDNKWIQSYEGTIQGKELEMILQKVDNHRVVGTAYFLKDKKNIAIRGVLTTSNNLHLTLVDATNQHLLGSIRAIYRNPRDISASYYDQNNLQSFASFKLINTIEVNCLEYADYFSNYEFLYPKSEDVLFNQIMAFLTKDWVADSKKQSQSTRKNSPTPALRASQRGYTWTEISLYKDDFLSGLLTYDNTWSNKKDTKAFNYDFANKSSIELEDIFKAGFDYRQYIRNYIKDYLEEDAAYRADIGYQAWIDQQSFSLFTVGRDGLSFFTDYHSVYGRQSVLIPYKKIKSNTKRQATIRRLF